MSDQVKAKPIMIKLQPFPLGREYESGGKLGQTFYYPATPNIFDKLPEGPSSTNISNAQWTNIFVNQKEKYKGIDKDGDWALSEEEIKSSNLPPDRKAAYLLQLKRYGQTTDENGIPKKDGGLSIIERMGMMGVDPNGYNAARAESPEVTNRLVTEYIKKNRLEEKFAAFKKLGGNVEYDESVK